MGHTSGPGVNGGRRSRGSAAFSLTWERKEDTDGEDSRGKKRVEGGTLHITETGEGVASVFAPDKEVIEKYQIVKAVNVQSLVIEGWQPYGSPFVHEYSSYQALVKRR